MKETKDMTLDILIQRYTDSSGKWVATDDVKKIIEIYTNQQTIQTVLFSHEPTWYPGKEY